MGHLLSSINPDAAERIRPADALPPRPRTPNVGDIVIYHIRRGHGRAGRTRFPALVQPQGDDGRLALTVIMEAGELKNETLVEEIGPGKDDGHCWERPDVSHLGDAFRNTVAALATRVGGLEEENQALRAVVLGDFDVPKVSIIAIMQDFENRLRSIKQDNDDLRARLAAPALSDTGRKGKRK